MHWAANQYISAFDSERAELYVLCDGFSMKTAVSP